MRIAILGGTGFIGPQVVRQFEGHEITLFHRHAKASDLKAVSHVLCDRADLPGMRQSFEALNADILIDMMAQNGVSARQGLGMVSPFAGRVVMVSSAGVYRQYGRLLRSEGGAMDDGPAKEDAPVRSNLFPYRQIHPRPPDDPRSWMDEYDKIPAEAAYLSRLELDTSIIRLPMVFGPGDPDGRVERYVRLMRAGATEIRLPESVAAWRNARGFVGNVAHAIALVARRGKSGRIYNMADTGDYAEAEWVERIGRAAGWSGRVKLVPDGDPSGVLPLDELPEDADFSAHLRLDTGRIRSELGFVEPVSTDEALHRTVASVLQSTVHC